MYEAKKESEKRTTVLLDREKTGSGGRRNGLPVLGPNNDFARKPRSSFQYQHGSAAAPVPPKQALLVSGPGSSLHQQQQNRHNLGTTAGGGLLSTSHPLLDRNSSSASTASAKHQQRAQHNPEIMKRGLR